MYKIISKTVLADKIVRMDILAPRVATSALPGQFIILKADSQGERIPLTICDYDAEAGTVAVVIQAVGKSTEKISAYGAGESFEDFAGPLGQPSEFVHEDLDALKKERIVLIAGGLGAAPIYPQAKWLHAHGVACDVIIGSRNKNLLIMEREMSNLCDNLYICTDDGSYGFNGNVTAMLRELVVNRGIRYDRAVAIGPMIMMKFACLTTKELGIPTIVSMNPIMVDGTGMCGACRVSVGGKIKFACVDGPEFDGHLIDFDEAMRRSRIYQNEGERTLDAITETPRHAQDCPVHIEGDKTRRVPMAEQPPAIRARNFGEVALGYTRDEAMLEAERCLNCRNPKCVDACPVSVNIPGFIQKLREGNFDGAAGVIFEASSLPAICGRVCPQENQCEGVCIRAKKGEAVAIGRLERFVGDYAIENNAVGAVVKPPNGKRVAVIGAGPAGLACAGDLARLGYGVKIFEALHEPGGVLVYGIPEFRLPKEVVVAREIENIKRLGVEIETNAVAGRTFTVDSLMDEEGFDAVFIGSGAGLPRFMGIPGENANGVFSANEYLTRSNLMKAYSGEYDTPIAVGRRVAVVGGGNVAMDAARTALRLGSEVHIVYRRGADEIPARLEEVHHAREEGVIFDLLTNPTEILADEAGQVTGMKCVKMRLGEPDASGRRSPVEMPGSEFVMDVDMVLMALGTSPNPLIAATTDGVVAGRGNTIVIDGESGMTNRPGVFAGGDAVTGAATVILAMGAGKTAARGIDRYLSGM